MHKSYLSRFLLRLVVYDVTIIHQKFLLTKPGLGSQGKLLHRWKHFNKCRYGIIKTILHSRRIQLNHSAEGTHNLICLVSDELALVPIA